MRTFISHKAGDALTVEVTVNNEEGVVFSYHEGETEHHVVTEPGTVWLMTLQPKPAEDES